MPVHTKLMFIFILVL